jgi:hypothetical protein
LGLSAAVGVCRDGDGISSSIMATRLVYWSAMLDSGSSSSLGEAWMTRGGWAANEPRWGDLLVLLPLLL